MAYDLATRDKLPVIRKLMACEGEGLALDIGIGTGYTTSRVFGDRPTVCVDLDLGNLRLYRDRSAGAAGVSRPMCVIADATALPFKTEIFRFVLCSEVMEHLEDDRAAAGELGRVLAQDGRAVITVPYTGLGFTSFLELLGIKTVHDFPGPEHHVRPGHDERVLERLVAGHGLRIIQHAYYFRFFTRIAADSVSLAHLLYQRIVHRRRSWTWAEAAAADGSVAFALYLRLLRVFQNTLPSAAVGPIAVLHLDGDWNESVKVCLDRLCDRVSSGGVIQIDDYGHWEGARAAVDEFMRRRRLAMPLSRLDYTGRQLIKP